MRYWIAGHAGDFGRAVMTLGDDNNGVTILEYSLIAALIATVCVSAVATMGTDLSGWIASVAPAIAPHH